jgi:hypothetical protein
MDGTVFSQMEATPGLIYLNKVTFLGRSHGNEGLSSGRRVLADGGTIIAVETVQGYI